MSTIICENRSYSNQAEIHSHHYSQLILPLEGDMVLKTSKHELTLDENHLFFLPSQCNHEYYSKSKNSFLVLDIPSSAGKFITVTGEDMQSYQLMDDKWNAIRFILLEEQKNGTKGSLIHLTNYIYELLKLESASKSIEYIHNNLDKKLLIKDLAKLENFNQSYYIKWFQEKTGSTPNEYIRDLRIKKASEYLTETDMSILDISNLVGYEKQSSLTRLFNSKYGIAPAKYRKTKRI